MKVERKNIPTLSYSELLKSFEGIGLISIDIISSWRANHGAVLDKINANGVHDVVTDVDIAIEELTRQTIENSTSGIKVLGEESFKQDFTPTEEPFYVVVDPIDGTREFINGTQDWSISICAVENNIPVVASVFLPDKNELFTSIRGSGVWLNGKPFYPQLEKNGLIGVSPRQIKEDAFKSKIERSQLTPTHISALTPKICAILRGDIEAAVYFEQEGVSAALWDYAAVHLLIHEYGGRMTSLTGEELPFSGNEVIHKKGWVAVADKSNHDQLLACLQT